MDEKEHFIEINNEPSGVSVDISAESAHWSKRCIYRIPPCVTDLNKKVYAPQMVSLGPYHHGTRNLSAMEVHKRRALSHFLKRSGKPFCRFVHALTPAVQDLRDAYDNLDSEWQDDEKFLKLMIVDGCFVLEILRTTTATMTTAMSTTATTQTDHKPQDYASNDPIFSNHGKLYFVPYLRRDMSMLENQLPMRVLEELVSVQNDDFFKEGKLKMRILEFFSQPVSDTDQFDNCLHMLDLYRRSLLGKEPLPQQKKKRPRISRGGDEIIRSATELTEAGIRIEKSKTRSLRDISFHRGVLKLPLIMVDDTLESLYLNLIAFERFHVGAGNDITSYIFFMDNIIDSARDVSLLHSCGIIQNALGSDKMVANLFNSLSRDAPLDPESKLNEVHQLVSDYCQKTWHKWRANLKHTYFTNPWASLSVIAAIFLFALTIIQTVYTILQYVNPSSS
ncbi:hypothetical protein Salat_2765200 [Sesamum alatum]|uniref:Uncharacterized protein n=1 Tax=Sesamum alatum TaxID=300844 RepID=A0AAE2C952_9LAMI|nr:hypothetical protein Salat_2765200 [Sesamum alatum]